MIVEFGSIDRIQVIETEDKAAPVCPPATQDIGLNIKNRQNAIDTAGYGPLNPAEPNDEFWDKKGDRWSVSIEEAKKQVCGNCIMFVRSPRVLKCIEDALGNETGNTAMDIIEAGDIGYCEAFDFKCHAARTCDAWVVGGPTVTDGKSNHEHDEEETKDVFGSMPSGNPSNFGSVERDGTVGKPPFRDDNEKKAYSFIDSMDDDELEKTFPIDDEIAVEEVKGMFGVSTGFILGTLNERRKNKKKKKLEELEGKEDSLSSLEIKEAEFNGYIDSLDDDEFDIMFPDDSDETINDTKWLFDTAGGFIRRGITGRRKKRKKTDEQFSIKGSGNRESSDSKGSPCWDGYKQVGMKKGKNGRMVPNCVPISPEEKSASKPVLRDPKGGLTAAGRKYFKNKEGADLKPGVKGPADTPDKMRRKGSFLVRFFTTLSGPLKDENGRPTRLALSAAAWGEPVPQTEVAAKKLAAKGQRLLERYRKLQDKQKKKEYDSSIIEEKSLVVDEIDSKNFITPSFRNLGFRDAINGAKPVVEKIAKIYVKINNSDDVSKVIDVKTDEADRSENKKKIVELEVISVKELGARVNSGGTTKPAATKPAATRPSTIGGGSSSGGGASSERYDPKAVDRDGDGNVQEGTDFMRPAQSPKKDEGNKTKPRRTADNLERAMESVNWEDFSKLVAAEARKLKPGQATNWNQGLLPNGLIADDGRFIPAPIEMGNIDLSNRKPIRLDDGSFATIRSMSGVVDGKEVLIPTVGPNGENWDPDTEEGKNAAWDEYFKTGKHLGKFNTPEEADVFGEWLHQQEAKRIGEDDKPDPTPPPPPTKPTPGPTPPIAPIAPVKPTPKPPVGPKERGEGAMPTKPTPGPTPPIAPTKPPTTTTPPVTTKPPTTTTPPVTTKPVKPVGPKERGEGAMPTKPTPGPRPPIAPVKPTPAPTTPNPKESTVNVDAVSEYVRSRIDAAKESAAKAKEQNDLRKREEEIRTAKMYEEYTRSRIDAAKESADNNTKPEDESDNNDSNDSGSIKPVDEWGRNMELPDNGNYSYKEELSLDEVEKGLEAADPFGWNSPTSPIVSQLWKLDSVKNLNDGEVILVKDLPENDSPVGVIVTENLGMPSTPYAAITKRNGMTYVVEIDEEQYNDIQNGSLSKKNSPNPIAEQLGRIPEDMKKFFDLMPEKAKSGYLEQITLHDASYLNGADVAGLALPWAQSFSSFKGVDSLSVLIHETGHMVSADEKEIYRMNPSYEKAIIDDNAISKKLLTSSEKFVSYREQWAASQGVVWSDYEKDALAFGITQAELDEAYPTDSTAEKIMWPDYKMNPEIEGIVAPIGTDLHGLSSSENSITKYAEVNSDEDWAESFMYYYADKMYGYLAETSDGRKLGFADLYPNKAKIINEWMESRT